MASLGVAFSCASAVSEARKSQPATAQISWPAVTSVLDGTDLTDIKSLSVSRFEPQAVEGNYRAEQGGSLVSLLVRRVNGFLQVERTYREPGRKSLTKTYEFRTVTPEGAVSVRGDAFLKRTREGLLLFEKDSGVDSIPATYWVHYIRRKQ